MSIGVERVRDTSEIGFEEFIIDRIVKHLEADRVDKTLVAGLRTPRSHRASKDQDDGWVASRKEGPSPEDAGCSPADPRRLHLQDALANGKEVFVPYIHNLELSSQPKTSVMDMLLLESMDEFRSLEPDKWGIPSLSQASVLNKRNCFGGKGVSPRPEDSTQGPYGLDLIVMPGMAFDEGFRRLGHGKVALALKEQVLAPTEKIPVADHDWLVDVLMVGDDRCLVRQR
ncbi:5-formyltetrahydrofolate cyclo-ligase [Aspergillus luchuensis]|uniref:5-formyltetrahydrofolate cyclo-ligase n=1 Tax=Aspergillus kawachii TaxID=1069201 RepID=A0A146F0Q2_ASPKA|nr:5-formyltetrahydrofolate cyclo-ligase [Aspergillus luchuensis]